MKADILQIPVSTLSMKEAGALGGAILGAAACGAFASVEDAAAAMSNIGETFTPNATYQEFYSRKFELYKQLHLHVKQESAFAAKSN
jgi:sugar (pentulose or hexulose) kinase